MAKLHGCARCKRAVLSHWMFCPFCGGQERHEPPILASAPETTGRDGMAAALISAHNFIGKLASKRPVHASELGEIHDTVVGALKAADVPV